MGLWGALMLGSMLGQTTDVVVRAFREPPEPMVRQKREIARLGRAFNRQRRRTMFPSPPTARMYRRWARARLRIEKPKRLRRAQRLARQRSRWLSRSRKATRQMRRKWWWMRERVRPFWLRGHVLPPLH